MMLHYSRGSLGGGKGILGARRMSLQMLIEIETGHQLWPSSGQPWQAIGDFVAALERYCNGQLTPEEEDFADWMAAIEANVQEDLCLLAQARSHPWHLYRLDQYDQFVANHGPTLTQEQFKEMLRQAGRTWADPAALQTVLRQLVAALTPLSASWFDLRQVMLDAEDVIAALRVADRAGLRVRLLVY